MSGGSGSGDRIRILVAGDSRVGKTALIHLLCYGEVHLGAASTVGAKAEVKLHEYSSRQYCVEIIEVGGSSKYEMTRPQLFPHLQPNALILVYDLTNRKSYNNLKRWLRELTGGYFKWAEVDHQLRGSSQADHRLEAELADGQILPILLIGNKLDLLPKVTLASLGTTVTIDDMEVEALQISAGDSRGFLEGSLNADKVAVFLNKTIYRKFFDKSTSLRIGRGPSATESRDMWHSPQFRIDIPSDSLSSKFL